MVAASELEIADWRRRVHAIYAEVRDTATPQTACDRWRAARDRLFASHPQSPLVGDDALRQSGLAYFGYDPALRFLVSLNPDSDRPIHSVHSTNDGTITMRRIGSVTLPVPVNATVDVWWLAQYGGGIFLPLRDGTSGRETYGGGRYLLEPPRAPTWAPSRRVWSST